MRIARLFESIQGEGDLAGVPMFFVRLSGCSVFSCQLHPSNKNLCDTDWSFREDISVDHVVRQICDSGLHWVCVTGGEPANQLNEIVSLAAECHKRGKRVMLQTSGAVCVPDCWDWLVVSPKQNVIDLSQRSGHEMKFIWCGEDYGYLRALVDETKFLRYVLQPIMLPSGEVDISGAINVIKRCGQIGLPWRLGVQQHKIFGIE